MMVFAESRLVLRTGGISKRKAAALTSDRFNFGLLNQGSSGSCDSVALAAGSATLSLSGLVDVQRTTFELLATQFLDGLAAVVFARHCDESESAWTTGFPVSDDGYFVYSSVSGKVVAK